jgi:hypothetical protein
MTLTQKVMRHAHDALSEHLDSAFVSIPENRHTHVLLMIDYYQKALALVAKLLHTRYQVLSSDVSDFVYLSN